MEPAVTGLKELRSVKRYQLDAIFLIFRAHIKL